MTVGYRNAAGVDFDSLFDPYVQGTAPANTGLRTSGGVDLAGRYAPIAFGTKGADVGFRTSGGTDVSNLWAAIGTAVYTIAGLNGKTLSADDTALTGQSTVSASVTCNILNNGTWNVSGSISSGSVAQPAPTSGTWLPSGHAVSDYEVQFGITSSGSADRIVGNGAPSYSACTTSRAASLSLPSIAANNSIDRSASATLTISLRRISTGTVTTTTVGMSNHTLGYL